MDDLIKNIQNNIFEGKITDEEMVNLLYKLEKENKQLKIVESDYIRKDKIIAKIALLKKSKKWYLNGEKQYFSTFDIINSKIDLLKELLEEGE